MSRACRVMKRRGFLMSLRLGRSWCLSFSRRGSVSVCRACLVSLSSLRGACLVSLLSFRGRLGLRAVLSSLCSRRGSVSLRRARFFVVVCCFHHMRGFSEHSLRTSFGMRPEVVRSNDVV